MLHTIKRKPGIVDEFSFKAGDSWEHTPLSNGFIEPDDTHVEGEYQASKAARPVDAAAILACKQPFGPQGAKAMGRKVVPVRPDWEEIKYQVMVHFVTKKFLDHPELAQYLLDTGDALLIEGNTWHDNIWGDCRCEDPAHPECRAPGTNWLGHVLMGTREILRILPTH